MKRVETAFAKETRPGADEPISRIKDENVRLRSENEQLRRIFDDAVDQFNRQKKELEKLGGELQGERYYRKELEKQNDRLKKELMAERAKSNKFADMLFGLKSEKLKISDIEIQDGNTLRIEEESETEISPAGDPGTGKVADKDADTLEGDVGTADEQGKPATDKRKKKKPGGQSGHAGSGRKIPEGLPVVDRVVTLPEGEIIHGIPAEDWIEQNGMEETSILIRKKVEWHIERIVRRKYAPPEGAGPDVPKIITAPMPDKLIPQGKYALEVWLDILIEKFQQHVPVQRQIFAAQQAGVNLIPGTVFGGLKTIYETHLKPLYEQLIVELRQAEHWHADETRWYMLRDALKKLWYMWGFKSEKATVFVLDPTRSAEVPAEALLGIEDLGQIKEPVEIPKEKLKILNVDRYSAYKALANLGLLILAFCWAHVRRDFTDIVKKYPEDAGLVEWARNWLLKIAEIYRINNLRIKHPPGSEPFLEYDTRLRRKLDKMEKEVAVELEMDEKQVHEARFKAMESLRNHWDGLTVFVDHPEVPMDNNRMENGIRPCALGRNNYVGNHSEWGGELSACMYSIIQTCIQNRINPKAYLSFYLEKRVRNKEGMTGEAVSSMLPGNLDKSVVEEFDLTLKKF
jgi:transposase